MIIEKIRKSPTTKQYAYEERPSRKQDKRVRRMAREMKAYQEQLQQEEGVR